MGIDMVYARDGESHTEQTLTWKTTMVSTTKKICLLLLGISLTLAIFHHRIRTENMLIDTEDNPDLPQEEDLNWYDARNTWLQEREELLSANQTTKVFFFSYMRGGSSIGGELFNQDPKATMWYEPGTAFFSSYHGLMTLNVPVGVLYTSNKNTTVRRVLHANELTAMTEFYSNMFTCQYKDLPPEAMGHPFLAESTAMDGFIRCVKRRVRIDQCRKFINGECSNTAQASIGNSCHENMELTRNVMKVWNSNSSRDAQIKSICKRSNIKKGVAEKFIHNQLCLDTMDEDNKKCMGPAVRKCKSDQVRVVQVNRMKMEDLEPLIQKHPDLFVIHYIRDPRAIALSRLVRPITKTIDYLCPRMTEDLVQRKRLENKYPGAFLQIKYEDLVQTPEETGNKIYDFFGKVSPPGWIRFAAATMHTAGKKGHGGFGITVANATETAYRWKSHLPREALVRAQSVCKNFLQDLGYPLN